MFFIILDENLSNDKYNINPYASIFNLNSDKIITMLKNNLLPGMSDNVKTFTLDNIDM